MSDEQIQIPAGLTTDGLIARRYLARIIDSVIIGLLAGIILTLFLSLRNNPLVVSAIVIGIFVIYGGLLESSTWQATIGKKILGMRVFATDGQRLSLGQALARGLVKDGPFVVLSILPFGQLLQFVWLGLHIFVVQKSPVYQAIHDRVAGTLVAAEQETTRLNLSTPA